MQRSSQATQQRTNAACTADRRRRDPAAPAHRFPVQIRAAFVRLPRREGGAHQ